MEQGPVGVAAVLHPVVGMHHQAGGGLGPLQRRRDQRFGHRVEHVPAHDECAGHLLKGAQVSLRTVSERQIRNVGHPLPVGLGRFGRVEQPVGGAAQPTGGIRGARRVGLGLQGPQAPAGQPHAQGLTVHAAAQLSYSTYRRRLP